MKIANEGLLRADLGKRINFFAGAGFSILAKNSRKETLPVGEELKLSLIREFGLERYSSLDLPSIYAVIVSDRRDALRAYLESTYTVDEYDSRYDGLRKLALSFYYTTNIDDLAWHIFSARAGTNSNVLHDVYLYGAPRSPDNVVQYIPLHGSVRHEDADFLFTAGQMSSAFASDRETWYVFQRELQLRPTLFAGYGLRDAGTLQALHDSSSSSVNRWIALRKEDEAAAALYESLGFQTIVADTVELLSFFDTLDNPMPSTPIPRPKLPGTVPLAVEAAQRPVKSFFLGAEPEWSDAYSPQIVRRRINTSVKNSIYSGRHVALVGLPLSGKTTILKQIAVELSVDRPTQYFDRISEPQVDQILQAPREQNARPLIFVDNLIDSRDAIEQLVNQMGAQIVSAEDSLYFDSVSLKSMTGKLDVHSCSEVSDQDIQAIVDSIPAEVRRWHVDDFETIEVDFAEVGLFESLRRHVFDEGLTDRFKVKLAEFEARDPQAFDVYIMAAYVAACRVFVSFDMMYMFINSPKKQYRDVYDITARISAFLAEIDLPDDPHQDYFSVRSGALAKIALKQCSPRAFGRVFDRFHSAVPAKLIVDYPVFRRYAYDNDYARRAYPRMSDGLKFYERLVRATDNAYDYQHGAVYLSKMKNFAEAFSWIDTAMSKSRGRVYSIRNTHARILFEANIDIVANDPTDQTALEAIGQSMAVLQECIIKDQRRTYHLLRFSDQALQYAEIVSDSVSVEWLVMARDRLKEMADQASISRSRESYNLRRYRGLLSEVRSALGSRGIS